MHTAEPVSNSGDRSVVVTSIQHPTLPPHLYSALPNHGQRILLAIAGARTELVPMTRTSALSRLVEQVSVSPPDAGAGLLHLIQAVRALDCYTLTMGNLQEGGYELQRLVAGARPPVLR